MSYLRLKGISEIGESLLSDQLATNLVSFFNYSFLTVGAFYNIVIPTSGAFGGQKHRLRSVQDPNYVNGQVWEGYRRDWVWEQNIDYATQPVRVSGVIVNGTFYPVATTGVYSHFVDYINGRIIFNSAISTTGIVHAQYSHRYVHFTTDEVGWFREIQTNSFRLDQQFLQTASGAWSILSQNRVQLPAVVVEVIPERTFTGWQLGGGQIVHNDVLYHIFAETPWERSKIFDILTFQNDKTIHSFNKNILAASGRFPLDEYGSLASGALMYPELVNMSGPWYWKRLRFTETRGYHTNYIPQVYQAIVKTTVDIIMGEI